MFSVSFLRFEYVQLFMVLKKYIFPYVFKLQLKKLIICFKHSFIMPIAFCFSFFFLNPTF